MALITHRINWTEIPYSYTEVAFDSDTEGELTDDRMVEWANYAKAMEQAAVEMGFKPKQHPMVQEALAQGAVPEMAPRPQQNSSPQGGANSGPSCEGCGGPTQWSAWRNSPKGGKMRFPECTGNCVNDKGYSLSGRPQFQGGR